MKKIQSYQAAETAGILLNANENNLPMDERIHAAIMEKLQGAALNRYPDNDETELLQAYGNVIGVSPECILAGNGSDQMLGYLISTFLGKGKILYTLDPDFSMYDYYASSYEAEVKKFDVEEDGSFDIDAFIEQGRDASLVMFSNPNNPTGQCLSEETIEKILQGFSVPVVVDEAYIEFSGQESSIRLMDRCSNLYVTRTLSKAYGLAGLRVGFAVSCAENMKTLKQNFVPYTLNCLSMAAASAVLQFHDAIALNIQKIIAERERVCADLQKMDWLAVLPSKTNFVYCRSRHNEPCLQELKKQNILSRDYAGTDTFRISIGTEQENNAVLDAAHKLQREMER